MIAHKTVQLSWNWQVIDLPQEIWPFITDTNCLFKNLHHPSIQKFVLDSQ